MLPEPGTMRRLLRAEVERAALDGPPAICFSGGTDSLAMLFAAMDVGLRPRLYTYHIEGVRSADLARAEWAAGRFGLDLVACPIPSRPAAVLADVRWLIAFGCTVGKVAIQCMHGHLYVASAMQQHREVTALNGSGVDGLYGSYREMAIAARQPGPSFDVLRARHLANPNDDCMVDQGNLYAAHGVRVAYPYRAEGIVAVLAAASWQEMNRPRLKWITVRDFPEITRERGLFRPRGSQQIVAGTRELHEALLALPENRLGRRRVADLYRDLAHA